MTAPIELQRSPKKDLSSNKHKLRGPGAKYVSASKRARMMEKGTISESEPIVRKVESDEEDSDLDCSDKSEGKPVHVDIDKETTEGNKSTLALLPNRSDEVEVNNNGETRDGDGIISLRKSNRTFKPPERLGSVP